MLPIKPSTIIIICLLVYTNVEGNENLEQARQFWARL